MRDMLWAGYEYLQQGGWVMIPLGLTSLAMWSLIVDRLLSFHALSRHDVQTTEALAALAAGRPAGAGETGLRRALLHALLTERSGEPELDRNILAQHALALRPRLREHLQLIAVLAAVAPLLGLLGTVLGMIETFEVIALFGTGNAKAMAGGISVALVTTQAGLLIAVPGLLVSAALARRARRLEMGFDEFTHLLDRALKNENQAMLAEA
jgi:biopolymer transport protein ExbB